jgi:uncharacterized membrane protein
MFNEKSCVPNVERLAPFSLYIYSPPFIILFIIIYFLNRHNRHKNNNILIINKLEKNKRRKNVHKEINLCRLST